jgi:spore coat protein U-like protein
VISAKATLRAFALGALLTHLGSTLAAAATPTASFSVSATVVAGCTVSAAAAFQNYKAATSIARSTLSVVCSTFAPYTVSLSDGKATGEILDLRTMASSGQALLDSALASNSQVSVNSRQIMGGVLMSGVGTTIRRPSPGSAAASDPRSFTAGAGPDLLILTVTY